MPSLSISNKTPAIITSYPHEEKPQNRIYLLLTKDQHTLMNNQNQRTNLVGNLIPGWSSSFN